MGRIVRAWPGQDLRGYCQASGQEPMEFPTIRQDGYMPSCPLAHTHLHGPFYPVQEVSRPCDVARQGQRVPASTEAHLATLVVALQALEVIWVKREET